VAGSVNAWIDLKANASFTLNAEGTALNDWTLNLSLSGIDVNVSSLTLAGDLGLASFTAKDISLEIDPGLTLTLSTSSASSSPTVHFSDVTLTDLDELDVDDLSFCASILIASALGDFAPQTLKLDWADIESTDSISVSGTAITTALDIIHDLAGSLQDGLTELGTKAQDLADSILSDGAFAETELPLVGRTLEDILDVGAIIDGVIGAGSSVIDYLAVHDLSTTKLSFDTDNGDFLILSDSNETHLIEADASAETIERILGYFSSIGQGRARVHEVIGADSTQREFRIGSRGPLSSLAELSVVAVNAASLDTNGEPGSKVLTLDASGDVVALKLGSEYAVFSAEATTEAIAASLAEISNIGAGNVEVVETTTTGPRSFTITLLNEAISQLAFLATAGQSLSGASIEASSYSELTGLSFSQIEAALPSFDNLSSVIAERIQSSLTSFLSGALGVGVEVGLDQDGLTFTLAPTRFGATKTLELDLGADLAEAGITLTSGLSAEVSAGLEVGLTFGLDLSRLATDVATITAAPRSTDESVYTLEVQKGPGLYTITDGTEFAELSTQLSASEIEAALGAWSSIGADNIAVTGENGAFTILITAGASLTNGLEIAAQTPEASDFFIQFDTIKADADVLVKGDASLAADLAGATGSLAAAIDASLSVDVDVVVTNNDKVALLSAVPEAADTYTLTLTGESGDYTITVGNSTVVLNGSIDTAEALQDALNAGINLGERSFVVSDAGGAIHIHDQLQPATRLHGRKRYNDQRIPSDSESSRDRLDDLPEWAQLCLARNRRCLAKRRTDCHQPQRQCNRSGLGRRVGGGCSIPGALADKPQRRSGHPQRRQTQCSGQ